MRILTACSVGYPIRGGSQITHLTFLEQLASRGHDCVFLDHSHTRRRIRRAAVTRDYYRDLEELRSKLTGHRPDVVLAAHDVIHHVVRLCREADLPCVAYLNSFEYCPPSAREKRTWELSWDKPYPLPAERAFALANADRVLVNSRFLARRLERLEGVASEVVYPAFDERTITRRRRPAPGAGRIAGVCGYAHKGADVFLELARRFPDERFLLVGNVEHRFFQATRQLPNVEVLPFGSQHGFFARAKIFLVPSRWAEPFGRVAVEAMANGLPTLVSRTGGLSEIAGSSGLAVARFRTADAWGRRLSDLLDDEGARQLGSIGRERAERFLGEESAIRLERVLIGLVRAARAKPRQRARQTIPVELRGLADARTAFARVNARWLVGLERRGRVRVQTSNGFATYAPRVVIHHDYSQNFAELEPPPEGRLIAVRTWDFGPFPRAWVERIDAACDALWVHSRYVRRHAISSGVQPHQVTVIPHGVDRRLFTPDGPAHPLPTAKPFRFLFVGAPVFRKGIDVLLEAFGRAFDASDPVCLVVKGSKRDVFYRGIGYGAEIRKRARSPGHPEILYLDEERTSEEIAALYRACDVGVFPYRAEGFAMPILEAMACGVPSIVPDFGACLDYCTRATSFFVPARRIRLPVVGEWAYNTLGYREDLEEVEFCEIEVEALSAALRGAFETRRAGVPRRGVAGAKRARDAFTWDHALARIETQLEAVASIRTPRRFRKARRAAERDRTVFQAAKELYLMRGGGPSPRTS